MISLILSLCETNMNHYINMLFILQAKVDGHLVKHALLYSILHTCKDGSIVNEVVKEKMVSNPCKSCSYVWKSSSIWYATFTIVSSCEKI